jgi:hypothetical protein
MPVPGARSSQKLCILELSMKSEADMLQSSFQSNGDIIYDIDKKKLALTRVTWQ